MIFRTARKYRIYPNPIQKEIIDRTLGACRFIYNKFIEILCKQYERNEPLRVPTNYSWIEGEWLFDKSITIDRGSFPRVWSDVKSDRKLLDVADMLLGETLVGMVLKTDITEQKAFVMNELNRRGLTLNKGDWCL